jgi:hypothetical protein
MKLPKSLTTVTGFSKTLALLLFMILPLVGFNLGIQYQKKLSPQTATINEPAASHTLRPTGTPAAIITPVALSPTCRPRPACLDATPRCMIPETAYMCPPHMKPQKACTLEAKICPGGKAVGRTGPNCTFAPCP